MPVTGATHFVRPDAGGLSRDPETIRSHLMPGASDEQLLREAVSLSLDAARDEAAVVVNVTITNDGTGHHVPTDSPLRHLILVIAATDASGAPLEQTAGPTVPEWGGVGDPADGHYAGLPGTGYAKILEEIWTGSSPTGAYWNPTRVVSDNRIAALASDTTEYEFAAPASGGASITAILLYRRAFIELTEQKGWETADIEMARATIDLEE